MVLNPLPPDPEPTEADLVPFRDAGARVLPRYPVRLRKSWKRLLWAEERRQKDPNAFLVPFSPPECDADYRASERYAYIRRSVMIRDEFRCVCGGQATDIHHRDYRPRVLAGEDLDPIIAVCRPCHKKIHAQQPVRIWEESEKVLRELASRRK
jgi:hypothetical protein